MRFLNITGAFDHDNTTKAMSVEERKSIDIMALLSAIIASVGIVANATVIFAFVNHKKLRGKIPNIFIINQVECNFLQPGLFMSVAYVIRVISVRVLRLLHSNSVDYSW